MRIKNRDYFCFKIEKFIIFVDYNTSFTFLRIKISMILKQSNITIISPVSSLLVLIYEIRIRRKMTRANIMLMLINLIIFLKVIKLH